MITIVEYITCRSICVTPSIDVHTGNQNQENDDQNPGKDLGNVNDPKNPVNQVVKKIRR
ncbi:unnamed protein product [Lactuca saligna]|uniref:Uncharacterized protein n=1 Tax=Lactuca saligna TaxID=75948 RepID=A0AA35YD71_LACSI|nr:unnamed protein product [Lactuca saligna]